ncbi:Aldo/keto reductase, partial [Acaromyces ingoldii]
RKKVFLNSKHASRMDEQGKLSPVPGAQYPVEACEASLKHLHTDHIDLYQAHRAVEPVEEQMKGMKKLKDEGKIRYIGVSDFNLDQLERANSVVHIDAIEIELSRWTPDVLTNGILDWTKKNGTALIAYSPLGRGFLAGEMSSTDTLESNDFRKRNPTFEPQNFVHNLDLVRQLRKVRYDRLLIRSNWLTKQKLRVTPYCPDEATGVIQRDVLHWKA